jgi:ATP-dependent Clp protease protease subunit
MIPFVIENTSAGDRSYDIFSRLLQDRIIMLNGDIYTGMSHTIIAQMLFLESQDSDKEINLYINSGGGEVTAGLAIYDTMQFIKPDVKTIVIGQAASMGSLLAQAGTPGKRFVLPESRTMIHRVSSGTRGTSGSVHVTELQIEDTIRSHAESKRLNERLTELYVKHNSQNKEYDEFYETMKFDTFLSAQEAVDFGLADKLITTR